MLFLFDLDGPILDVSARYYRTYRRILDGHASHPMNLATFWEAKRNRTSNAELLSVSGAELSPEAYRERWINLIEQHELLDMDTIWPSVKSACDDVSRRIDCILVTLRTHADRVHRQLEQLGIRGWFQQVLSGPGADPRWMSKVDMIRNSGIHVSPDDWFIGDTDTDILAGRYLGMRTSGVTFGIRTKSLVADCRPDSLLESQEELAEFLRDTAR